MKKMLTVLGAGMLLVTVSATLTSCEGDKTYYEVGAKVWTDFKTVESNQWEWNDTYKRYEFIFDYPEIDQYAYEEDVVTAGVYMNEIGPDGKTFEVLRSLPFVHDYKAGNTAFTQVIGFDIAMGNPGTISFYIQVPEGVNPDLYLKRYQFKISFVFNV